MKRTCNLAVLLVLSGLVYCGCGRSQPKAPELEGTWIGQEVDGPKGNCRMRVQGDQMKFQGVRTNEWYSATLTLNQSTSPKQALIHIDQCGLQQYVNKDAHGIYKLENNTLTIAANEPGVNVTPTEFRRSASNQSRIFIFTRQ